MCLVTQTTFKPRTKYLPCAAAAVIPSDVLRLRVIDSAFRAGLPHHIGMLWALAVLEAVLWIYGMATNHRMGGVLHWLLVLAAVAVITELGLRWRDQRNVVSIRSRNTEQSSNLKKVA